MKLLSKRPSPSLVVSVAALVVALGGTSYAAIQIDSSDIKNNSVKSNDIKDKGVKGRDLAKDSMNRGKIKKNAVSSAKIADGAIQEDDLAPGVIPIGTRWALVNAQGQIEAQSGGFSVTAGYPALPSPGNGNVYIQTNEPLVNNGIVASIALQNTTDLNGDGVFNGRAPGADNNPEFSGEVTVSQCGVPPTNCAPPGTGTNSHLVVSPRNSDGSFTTAADRKRFYVFVTGDSTDYVGP